MSDSTADTRRLALLKRAYAAIDEQQARIRELESRITEARPPAREPLAIVGLSCRFPGAPDPESYWELLRNGTDATGEIPADRWPVDDFYDPDPEAAGRMYTRRGGFLQDVAGFDAAFFGISPREAFAMDPQHRMLLEITCEALDRAGQPRDRLAGSATGVFIGITANEYGQVEPTPAGLSTVDRYQVTGNTLNAAAGRIAYTFGFRGPALAVDTACSSSLVAVHLACSSIWQGDCKQAIAGGVHLMLSPAGHVALSRARVLSPSGRCFTFDARADGMVRGEGCGVVVIRPMSAALEDGDPIVAVIRGSAVNQDGPSSGLTVPNGSAQTEVIAAAVRNAGVDPLQLTYVEAHGTATPLGDPVEIAALGRALCDGRSSDTPLLIGSAKTNLGHLEAAAGIAGLIKVALSLERRELLPHLHFERPNPQVPWGDFAIAVVTDRRPWPSGRSPRIAGVSAFGFSGTNAHVVLEEAPERAAARTADHGGATLLRIAARSDMALRTLAARYAEHIGAHPEQALIDVAYTANTGRAEGSERAAVVATGRTELIAALNALANGAARAGVFKGRAVQRPRVGFVYRGLTNGAALQSDLHEREAVFRQELARCAAAVSVPLDREPELAALVNACAETALWGAWGVTPWGVLGHQAGRYAAAVATGVLQLEDAARRLLQDDGEAASLDDALAPFRKECGVLVEIGSSVTRTEWLERAAALYVAGVSLNWSALDSGLPRRRVLLPTYPWQRARFWRERPGVPAASAAAPDPCAEWTYAIDWMESDMFAKSRSHRPNVSMKEVDRDVQAHLRQLRSDPNAGTYAVALDALEQIAARGAARALTEMGIDLRARSTAPVEAAAAQVGVVEARRPLFARVLGAVKAADIFGGHEVLEASVARHPMADMELRILDRCLRALPAVLRGEQDPLSLLFPSDGSPSAAHLYNDSTAARLINSVVHKVIAALVQSPRTHSLRILEIGAGTGGTTASILPLLHRDGRSLCERYTFTDVSPAFLARAREKFAYARHLDARRLDIEVSPLTQGFKSGEYDVVIAANVLHATRDLRQAIAHAAQLLAPGGLLVIQEWTGPLLAIDLIFGLTDGWWRFADRELRASHPLVAVDAWQSLLADYGDVTIFGSTPADRGALAKQAVIVLHTQATAGDDVASRDFQKVDGTWLVLDARADRADAVRMDLQARGARAAVVGADATALRDALATAGAGIRGVVDLRAMSTPTASGSGDAVRGAEQICAGAIELVQELSRSAPGGCELQLVTSRAVSQSGECPDGVAQATLWGIGKVISLEQPEIKTRLIDLDATSDVASAIADVLAAATNETQIAFRDGKVWVPRLTPSVPRRSDARVRFDRDGAYVVTGGFGGLGLVIADWLITRGAGLVVLVGRRPHPESADALRRIEARGGRLMPLYADVSDARQVNDALASVRATGMRIAGVLHAAGVLEDGIVLQLTADRCARVLRPKIQGAWNLHTATVADRPDAFVLFSAATAMFGSAGQAAHAAANAWLDSFAAWRRSQALPALSINWGAWQAVGAASAEHIAARVRMKGLRSIDPQHGLEILERLLAAELTQVGVFGVDWERIPAAIAALPFVATCLAQQRSTTMIRSFRDEIDVAPPHRLRSLLAAHVRDEIRSLLALSDNSRIDMRQGLFELGMDSLSAMELRQRLQTSCGCALPATLVFDCPTPDAIVDYVATSLAVPTSSPLPRPFAPAAGAGSAIAGQDNIADLLGRKLAELRESLGSLG